MMEEPIASLSNTMGAALLSGWQCPAQGTFKINFDAAHSVEKGTGFGLVCRNAAGDLVFTACHRPTTCLGPVRTEAQCFKWAVEKCFQLGISNSNFETDCSSLIQSSKLGDKKNGPCSYLHSVMADCHALAQEFRSFSFSHVKRHCNKAADFMSKFAFNSISYVWFEEGPSDLRSIMLEDSSSASFPS